MSYILHIERSCIIRWGLHKWEISDLIRDEGKQVSDFLLNALIVYHFINPVSAHAPQMTPDVSYRGAYIDEGGNITATVTRRSPTVNIVCTVFDGYPKASNVSLQCGSFKQVIKNYTGVFTLPDAKNLDGARCVCSGEHVTKLYNKTTSFTLHVQYQSTVTKATANGEAGFVLVQTGTLVTIGCEADGNPKPKLSLYGLRTGDLTFGGPVAVDGKTLSNAFTASLATSDIYVCKADNGVDPINFGDRLVEVLVGDAVPTLIQRFTVNDQTTQLTVNEGDLLQFKCDTAGGSRRTSLRGMTSEMSLYDKTDTLGSSQINEWRTATCDFYDSFQCRVVSSGNVTAMQINVTVVGCNRVVTAITSSTIRTTTMTSSTALTALRVTWNGTVVIHGSEFKVPVRKSIQGKREIREVFYCSGPSQVSKIEFSCTIPGNIWPVSDSVLGSSSSFTLTTNTVDEWIKCTCTAYYWFPGSRTEKVSFQISSQADNKKGLIGMSIVLMGSVLTTVLATQFLGDQSWI